MSNYKPWPKDNEPTTTFEDLTQPLIIALKFAYSMRRKNRDKDIPWTGFDIGESLKATCFSPREALSAENLKYSEEDQGRDAVTEIIGLAIQIGIEQGRRIEVQRRLRSNFDNLFVKEALNDVCCISLAIPESTTSAIDKLKNIEKYARAASTKLREVLKHDVAE